MAVTGAFEAYGHSSELKKTWQKTLHYIKHGKLAIIVIGAGGVGKSTLAKFLANPTNKIPPREYSESFHVELCKLPGGAVAELITAPGQARHHDSWDTLFENAKSAGKKFGIIHVTSFGYHSTNIDIKALREGNETSNTTTLRYLGDCRRKEIEIANDLCARLKKHNLPIWMISLVAKQDLWWNEKNIVEKHYKEGDYFKAVASLAVAHTVPGFRHEYFSVALHSQNFSDGSGTLIHPTTGGYDDAIKYSHQEKLLSMINGFVGIN